MPANDKCVLHNVSNSEEVHQIGKMKTNKQLRSIIKVHQIGKQHEV